MMTHPLRDEPFIQIERFLGRRLEVVAFGISYVGRLKEVDLSEGFIVLSDGPDSAVLELERVDTYFPIE